MCFSATASFTAAGILGVCGTVALLMPRGPRTTLLASGPLLFALQQASEGVVWLTVGNPAHALVTHIASFFFLACALVLWPAWSGCSLLLREANSSRRLLLGIASIAGTAVSLFGLHVLLHAPINAAIARCSILYELPALSAALSLGYLAIYLCAVTIPWFLTSMPLAPMFGCALPISLGIALVSRWQTSLSVWCFFAALLSLMLIYLLRYDYRSSNI